jgi:hypothetical protein
MRWLALLVLLVAGCSHLHVLVCPRNGGPVWSELTSPHFDLRTDVPIAEARQTIAEYETIYAQFGQVIDRYVPNGPVPDRTEVILFARKADLAALQSEVSGWMSLESDRGRPTIVLAAGSDQRETFQHELCHRVMVRRLRTIPAWIDEGLADYLSSVRVVNGQFELGFIPHGRKLDSSWLQYLPVPDRIVRVSSYEFHHPSWIDVYYPAAWLLVHFFATHDEWEPHLIAYIKDIAEGTEKMDAFAQRFGTTEALLQPFRAHFALVTEHPERISVRRFPAPVVEPPALSVERLLGEEEIHLMWAAASHRGAEDQFDQIEAHVGDVPSIHLERARRAAYFHYIDTMQEELRKMEALASGSRHWQEQRTKFLIANSELEELPKLQAQVEQLATETDRPDLLNSAAWYYARLKKPFLGLPLAQRAAELVPESWKILDTLALLQYESGDRKAAIATQQEALARIPDGHRIPPEVIDRLRMYGGNVNP